MYALPILRRCAITVFATMALFALSAAPALAENIKVELSGKNEVPPVTTKASGHGSFSIADDGTISGSVTTTGIDATMAHIHEAAADANGPVRVPLEKKGDNQWVVPAGTRLNDAQMQALKSGKLYVNVHSKAHPAGELRAQLKP